MQWLADVRDGHWLALADKYRQGFPVPGGFVTEPRDPEDAIRNAYEELKYREKTHFVAVRAPSHALLDVLGGDNVVHTLRRLWVETPSASILVQSMVNADWCGKAAVDGKSIRVKASEGMRMLDADTYVVNRATRRCTRRTLQKRQRKVVRDVDGVTKTTYTDEPRRGLAPEQLAEIAALTENAQAEITWALDDRKVWLLGIRPL